MKRQSQDSLDGKLDQFEQCWPLGTIERTGVFPRALYGTAALRSCRDALGQIAGHAMRVRQNKTKTNAEIPIHSELAAASAASDRLGETIICTGRGRKRNVIYFGQLIAEAIEKAGLPRTACCMACAKPPLA